MTCRLLATLGCLLFVAMTGCTALTVSNLPVVGGEGGSVKLDSQFFDDEQITGSFDHCVYRFDSVNDFTVLMYDGTIDQPSRAMTIRCFWRPTASRTPIDSNATNATMQYFAFTEGDDGNQQVGVYSGAGYVYLNAKPGAEKINAEIWQATMRMSDRSVNYQDPLGQATMTGDTIALRNDAAMPELMHRLHTLVNSRLGYPRL